MFGRNSDNMCTFTFTSDSIHLGGQDWSVRSQRFYLFLAFFLSSRTLLIVLLLLPLHTPSPQPPQLPRSSSNHNNSSSRMAGKTLVKMDPELEEREARLREELQEPLVSSEEHASVPKSSPHGNMIFYYPGSPYSSNPQALTYRRGRGLVLAEVPRLVANPGRSEVRTS